MQGRNGYDRLRPVRRFARPFEAAQVRRFGRSLLSVSFRTPVLVLHTTGRRSGRPRRTTLAFKRSEDGSLVVVGGAGGQARLPDWVALHGSSGILRHESLAQCLRGVSVEARDRLRVEVEGETAAGVAEAGLSGRDVDAGGHEPSGVGSAEVVEREALEACGFDSWCTSSGPAHAQRATRPSADRSAPR